MPSSVTALINILGESSISLRPSTRSNQRLWAMGDSLQELVSDAFAGTFGNEDEVHVREIKEQTYCWQGNANNIPDLIVRSGDAIEVKKIESLDSDLALNSSPPKSVLLSSDSRICTAARRTIEGDEIDLVYAIGSIKGGSLHRLWLIDGDCFCASPSVYQNVFDSVKDSIAQLPFNFSPTNELGRINAVDPLARTNLRIRGMWTLSNPSKLFSEHLMDGYGSTDIYVMMRENKYQSLPSDERLKIDEIIDVRTRDLEHLSCSSKVVEVPDPDQPGSLISVRLISVQM